MTCLLKGKSTIHGIKMKKKTIPDSRKNENGLIQMIRSPHLGLVVVKYLILHTNLETHKVTTSYPIAKCSEAIISIRIEPLWHIRVCPSTQVHQILRKSLSYHYDNWLHTGFYHFVNNFVIVLCSRSIGRVCAFRKYGRQ